MYVTATKRTEIVTLHEHTAKTYREIAAVIGVSLACRVIKLKQDAGSVSYIRCLFQLICASV